MNLLVIRHDLFGGTIIKARLYIMFQIDVAINSVRYMMLMVT